MSDPSCSQCATPSSGKFCYNCGQSTAVKRISLGMMVHEAVHTFTHLDKGYLLTLRKLMQTPGTMQLNYLQGDRSRHQKPFSWFFLNATVYAIIAYWVAITITNRYGIDRGDEGNFFHHYFALTQVFLLPLYALVSWSVWKLLIKTSYNYGEILVLILYTAGMFMLFLSVITLTKLLFPSYETKWVELPIILSYNIMTNLRFFPKHSRGIILLGSAVSLTMNYIVSNVVATVITEMFLHP